MSRHNPEKQTNHRVSVTHSTSTPEPGLVRGISLSSATALNMIDMIGVGPFITIPLIIGAMGGPQAMLGWILGALEKGPRRKVRR